MAFGLQDERTAWHHPNRHHRLTLRTACQSEDADVLPETAPERGQGSVRIGDRSLVFLQVGDPNGPLVLHNHGGPSSRLEARVFERAAHELGLQFVCVDRPGMGKSDPQRNRTFASWAADLQAVADALGADQFAVTGWSEGGPWALAAAAYLDPARLVHVTSIAGGSYGAFGANWAAKALSKADALGGFLALHFRPGFQLMYELVDVAASRFPERYKQELLKAGSRADREVLSDANVLDLIAEAGRECFRQGAEGLTSDARALYEQWAFAVTAIQRPVHLWQGTADTFVPEAVNKPIGERMPGAVWHEVPDGGHFIAVSHADAILRIAARDLAGA
jgi:pimeloyl-ACP methyl ester carboxylesterase